MDCTYCSGELHGATEPKRCGECSRVNFERITYPTLLAEVIWNSGVDARKWAAQQRNLLVNGEPVHDCSGECRMRDCGADSVGVVPLGDEWKDDLRACRKHYYAAWLIRAAVIAGIPAIFAVGSVLLWMLAV